MKIKFECGYVADIQEDRVGRAIVNNWGLYCDECREEEKFKIER